jgi:hypothetical protein
MSKASLIKALQNEKSTWLSRLLHSQFKALVILALILTTNFVSNPASAIGDVKPVGVIYGGTGLVGPFPSGAAFCATYHALHYPKDLSPWGTNATDTACTRGGADWASYGKNITCPLHSSAPYIAYHSPNNFCTCHVDYVADATANNCLFDPYTLTLISPAGDLQPYTPATAASAIKQMSLRTVSSQTAQPQGPVKVRVTVDAQPNAMGGVLPRGTIPDCVAIPTIPGSYDCTTSINNGGYSNFRFIAPTVPSVQIITATCTNPVCVSPQWTTVNVLCPTGTQLNAAGTACEEQFTIALTSPAGDLEPSGTAAGNANSSKAMSVFVKSEKTGLAKSGAVVRVTLDAVAGSGGHLHNELAPNARPKGTLVKGLLPTDRLDCTPTAGILGSYDCKTLADGYAYFTYFAPIVSGTYAITAACTSVTCTNYSQSTVVDIKVAGLSQIPASSLYALTEADGSVIGAITGLHTDNHNMTPAAADALWRLVARYRFESRFQPTPLEQAAGATPRILYLNDASLPWGGVFDICPNLGAACKDKDGVTPLVKPWSNPHVAHRRGTVVDVRANSKPGAIPLSIRAEFERVLKKEEKIPFLHESRGMGNEHFHIEFSGRQE